MPAARKGYEKEKLKNKLFIFQVWAHKIPANKTTSEQLRYLFSLSQNITAKRPLIVLSPKSNEIVCYFAGQKNLWRLPLKLPRPLLGRPKNLPQLWSAPTNQNNAQGGQLPGGAAEEIWHQLIKYGQKLKINGQPLIKEMEKLYSLLAFYRPEISQEKMPAVLAQYLWQALRKHEIAILEFLAQIIVKKFAAQDGWYCLSVYGEIIYPIVCLKTSQPEKKLYFAYSLPFEAGWFWTQEITVKNFFLNLAIYHFS